MCPAPNERRLAEPGVCDIGARLGVIGRVFIASLTADPGANRIPEGRCGLLGSSAYCPKGTGQKHRPKILVERCQDIFETLERLTVAATLQNAAVRQSAQPTRQHIQRVIKCFSGTHRSERPLLRRSKDQNAPPFADALKAPRGDTLLVPDALHDAS